MARGAMVKQEQEKQEKQEKLEKLEKQEKLDRQERLEKLEKAEHDGSDGVAELPKPNKRRCVQSACVPCRKRKSKVGDPRLRGRLTLCDRRRTADD
jgi:hypothetical protein